MSKLAAKTDEWLKEAEQKYIDGIPAVTDENRKRLMQIGLDAVRDELQRRAQKKSEEPTGQLEQPERRLPTKEELQVWEQGKENKAVWYEGKQEEAKEAKQKFEFTMQKSGLLRLESNPVENKAFRESVMNAETRVIGTIEDPTPAPIPVVAIGFKTKEGKTEIRRLTQTDILTLLKTYFKRVATSAKMESKRYSEAYDSDMGKTVYKLFQGWNMIYNETQEGTAWPPLADVFPGLARASQQQKVNAEILWRWASNDK